MPKCDTILELISVVHGFCCSMDFTKTVIPWDQRTCVFYKLLYSQCPVKMISTHWGDEVSSQEQFFPAQSMIYYVSPRVLVLFNKPFCSFSEPVFQDANQSDITLVWEQYNLYVLFLCRCPFHSVALLVVYYWSTSQETNLNTLAVLCPC